MGNVIILGSGRSGTSMVAGTLAKAGYFMGDNLIPARGTNPKGFFEDREVNQINEEILAQVTPRRIEFRGKTYLNDRPTYGQRWLARIPLNKKIPSSPEIAERIHKITQKEPYCFKDPRFSYTLPIWKPFLNNVVFVCVFRNPATTATSILKECHEEKYLRGLSINFRQALKVWTLMYSHILKIHRNEGEWLFLHYNQVLDGECLAKLEAFTEAAVDHSFADPNLRRSFSELPVSRKASNIYKLLCEAAGYKDDTLKD